MIAVVDPIAPLLVLSSAEEVHHVRREVRRLTAKLITSPEALDDVELMTAEALANAVVHGSGVITVSVTADSARLRVSVWDQGPQTTSPNGQVSTDQIDHGRGLVILKAAILRAAAARWSLTMEPDQTCLWFEVDLDGSVEAQASPRPAAAGGGRPGLVSPPVDVLPLVHEGDSNPLPQERRTS